MLVALVVSVVAIIMGLAFAYFLKFIIGLATGTISIDDYSDMNWTIFYWSLILDSIAFIFVAIVVLEIVGYSILENLTESFLDLF